MHARPRDVPTLPSSSPPRGATCARWLAALSLLAAVGSARTQTCANPAPFPPNPPMPVHGSTGMGETGLSQYCKMFDSTGPAFVFRMNLDGWGASTIQLYGGEAGFNPVMYVIDGDQACGLGTCYAAGDPGLPIQVQDLPAGDHWLIVTASPLDAQGSQGKFELVVDGFPPDPSADLIFADGFE